MKTTRRLWTSTKTAKTSTMQRKVNRAFEECQNLVVGGRRNTNKGFISKLPLNIISYMKQCSCFFYGAQKMFLGGG